MSELLQNWLNNEVGLSTNVASFEKDFANGFLFGEVLHKFRQQDDFDQFSNKSTYEAKLANYRRLEPTLKALGIRINATQSNSMMNGERGASLRLLYQLKMATERLLLACDTGAGASKTAPTTAKGSPPGGGVTKSLRVPRDTYDDHERRFFEHRLRSTCPHAKAERVAKVTRKYEEERNKQEALAFHMDSLEEAHIAEQREIHRFGLRERMAQNRAAKDEWTRHSMDKWAQNMQRKATREGFDIAFAKRVHQTQQKKIDNARDTHSQDVYEGVGAFEHGLASLGLSKPPKQSKSAASRDLDLNAATMGVVEEESEDSDEGSENGAERLLAAATPAADARELVSSLQARMPNATELEQEAGLFLQTIQESKRAGSIARKERERRRRRVLVEQQKEQELFEESRLEEVLLEKLARQSEQEQHISYNVWKTHRYEEVIHANRQLRLQHYEEQRERDKEDAFQRDQDLGEVMRETMHPIQERERTRYCAIEQDRRDEERAQLASECEGILGLIADMALATMRQEQVADKDEVDPTVWREWMALFVNSERVAGPEDDTRKVIYPLAATHEGDDPESAAASGSATLDEAALRDYVESVGQWELPQAVEAAAAATASAASAPRPPRPEDEASAFLEQAASFNFADRLDSQVDVVGRRPVNFRLGAIVSALLERAHPRPPAPELPAMPEVPLRLVLSGRPCAGKKSLASKLAEAKNLQVVDVDEVVAECIALSRRHAEAAESGAGGDPSGDGEQSEAGEEADAENPYIQHLRDLGEEAQVALDRGETLSDELYVSMVVSKIRSLFPGLVPKQEPLNPDEAAAAEAAADGAGDEAIAEAPDAEGAEVDAEDGAEGGAQEEEGAGESKDEAADATNGVDRPRSGGSGVEGVEGAAEAPEGESSSAAADGEAGAAAEGSADEGEGDAAAEGAGAEAEEEAEEELSGWVLVGFPDDAVRLQLLERFLSGWVAPRARLPPPSEPFKSKAALIAPAPPVEPPAFEPVPGGYDLHVRLDVEPDEVVRRFAGLREDAATQMTYHLEDRPPATSERQVVYERLAPVDALGNSIGTLTSRVHRFDIAQPEVDEILANFGPFPDLPRLVSLEAGGPGDEVFASLERRVDELLERRRAIRARALAEKRAAEAAAAAAAAEAEAAAAAAEAAAAAGEDGEGGEGGQGGEADSAASPSRPTPSPGAASPDGGEVPSTPATPPPPEVVELEALPKIVESLEDKAFELLHEQWCGLEKDFTLKTQRLFTWHRAHLADFDAGISGIQRRFVDFLQRPDEKQSLVDDFVQRFNVFSEEYPEMRKQDETKEELHQRADDLQAKLVTLVDAAREENSKHLEAAESSGWVEAHIEVVAAQAQHAVRLEARRYHYACQLLTDFYFSAMGVGLPDPQSEPPAINALAVVEEPEPVEEKKGKPKAKAKAAAEPPPEKLDKSARRRRFVEPKRDPETHAVVEAGYWEFPFLQDLEAQAKAAVALWKPEDYKPPASAEKLPPAEVDPAAAKAKAKAKAAPKADAKGKKGQEEEVSVSKEPAPSMYVDLQQALLAERVTFVHRLGMIRSWAHRRLTDISFGASEVFERCHEWAKLRRSRELEAVQGLIDIVKEHIESSPPELISSRLALEGAHLHRHPNVRLQPPAPEIAPPAVEATAPFRWRISQLDALLEATHNANRAYRCSPGLCPVRAMHTLLGRLTQDPGEDLKLKEQALVPAAWLGSSPELLHRLFALFSREPFLGSVDTVEFMVHMALLHSPGGWPKLPELLALRKALAPLAPRGASWPDFFVSPSDLERACFDSDAAPQLFRGDGGDAEAAFEEQYGTFTSSAKSLFDRPREQLRWLMRVLERFPAKLYQMQAWELEVAHHDYLGRCSDEVERQNELFDDTKSSSSNTPRSPVDRLSPLLSNRGQLDNSALGSSAGFLDEPHSGPKPQPPRPAEPDGLPMKMEENAVSVRQLLAYLCIGATAEEGLARSVAVLGSAPTPSSSSSSTPEATKLPLKELHGLLLQIGARPTPSQASCDGRPPLPSLTELCQELELNEDQVAKGSFKMSAAELLGHPKAQRLIKEFGLRGRHCVAKVEALFSKQASAKHPKVAPRSSTAASSDAALAS